MHLHCHGHLYWNSLRRTFSMFPYRQKRLKMRVQFILDGWRPLTMATELGAWPVYEAEDCGRGYDTMSGTSTEASLYLLLPGRGSRGQGGPGRQQQQNKWTKERFTHSTNRNENLNVIFLIESTFICLALEDNALPYDALFDWGY